MRKHIFLLLSLLSTFYSFACLNGATKELKNGVYVYEDYQGIVPEGHVFFVNNYPKLIRELDSLYKVTKDLDYLSDKGYVLVIQNKYAAALEIYLKIEQLQPNRYSTASNVGTIYELMGDNKKALYWINKAIRINPKSHNGSEWLHAKILEAKIGGATYINSDFLIGTTFGEEDKPKNILPRKERKALIMALYYQLNERVSFIKTKDDIIGLLLFDLGNLAFLDHKYSDAVRIYEKAQTYGFQSELLKTRITLANWKKKQSRKVSILNLDTPDTYYQSLFINTLIVASIIILVLLVIIFRMRKRNRNSAD